MRRQAVLAIAGDKRLLSFKRPKWFSHVIRIPSIFLSTLGKFCVKHQLQVSQEATLKLRKLCQGIRFFVVTVLSYGYQVYFGLFYYDDIGDLQDKKPFVDTERLTLYVDCSYKLE